MSSILTRFTLREVLDFMWENKGKRCFKGFTYEQVAAIIVAAAKHKGLQIVADEKGLCGAAILRLQDGFLSVDFLVAVRDGFLTFLDFYLREYAEYPIIATRDGRKMIYNERQLCRLLRANYRAAAAETADSI